MNHGHIEQGNLTGNRAHLTNVIVKIMVPYVTTRRLVLSLGNNTL